MTGRIVQAAAGDMLARGDVIETGADGRVGITFADGTLFNLSSRARMGLDEFVCNPDGVPSSALFNLTQGTFAFVAGRLAKNGGLRVHTPFGTIRGDAQGGLIGVLTLVALTLTLLQEVEASPNSDVAFALDDIIDYKDLQHGTFEIVTKEAVPRVIMVDDPEVSVVIRQTPCGFQRSADHEHQCGYGSPDGGIARSQCSLSDRARRPLYDRIRRGESFARVRIFRRRCGGTKFIRANRVVWAE